MTGNDGGNVWHAAVTKFQSVSIAYFPCTKKHTNSFRNQKHKQHSAEQIHLETKRL